MGSSNIDITIGISCYNEELSIIQTIQAVCDALQQCELIYEILVINDASHDASQQVVQTYIQQHRHNNIKLHSNHHNQGLEKNVFTAAQLGNGNYFWMVAGDNALDQATYVTLLQQIGQADLIIPQVLKYKQRSRLRSYISYAYVRIINLICGFDIKYYNGSAIYLRRDVVEHADTITGFGYSAEMIISLLRQGKTYVEVPVIFQERVHGKSSALSAKNFVAIAQLFIRLLKQRWCS